MSIEAAGGIVAIIVSLTGAYIAWRKYRPETDSITVTSADKVNSMTLQFADKVSEDNDDLREQIAALRAEFTKYREDTDAEMALMRVELRAERAEKEAVKRENNALKLRVDELEAEVRALKSGRTP